MPARHRQPPADLSLMPIIQFVRDHEPRIIAKRAGIPASTLTRKIRALVSRGDLAAGLAINSFALGLRNHCVLFSPTIERERDARALVSYLQQHPRVSWFAEFVGEYRYMVSVLTSMATDLSEFFEELHKKFGPIMSSRSVSERTSLQLFPHRWFSNGKVYESPVLGPLPTGPVSVDLHDAKLLELLSAKPEATSRDLVRATGLPQTTVSYRLRRLKEQRVIDHYSWITNIDDYGYASHRLVLTSHSPSAAQRKAIEDFCRTDPHVYALASCVGAWDYEIALSVPHPNDLRALLQRLLHGTAGSLAKLHVLEHIASHRARWFPSAKVIARS